ncbi:MAG: hypothetical protein JXA42_04435, partial [Anaerolineales bacterium]|nr:hypothetical protein [Anaerolineales bacterium]
DKPLGVRADKPLGVRADKPLGVRAEKSLPTPAWKTETKPVEQRPAAESAFKTGQRVRHATFGDGIVIEAKPANGDSIITVAFEGQGLKRLMSSMAKLEIIVDGE